MNREYVSVLDIGSSKAVCLVARQSDARCIEPLAMGRSECVGLRRGAIADAESVAIAAAEAIRRAEAGFGRALSPLYVSIGGPEIQGSTKQGFVPIVPSTRPISRDDVMKVVNHSRKSPMPAGYEQIQAIARSFRVDAVDGIAQPIGMTGSALEVSTYLVGAPTEQIDRLENVVASAGKEVEGFVPSALASGLGVATARDLAEGVVVIDIGSAVTDICVFVSGAIAFHTMIPLGSQHVTSDLAQLLKTGKPEADRLKMDFGCALAAVVSAEEQIEVLQDGQTAPRPMARRVFAEIIESRMREIVRLAKAEIDRSGLGASLRNGVVLTGGGASMQGTAELFSAHMDVVNVRVGLPSTVGELKKTVNHPEYAAAVGLARFALDSDDDLGSAVGSDSWRDRIRTLWNLFSGER